MSHDNDKTIDRLLKEFIIASITMGVILLATVIVMAVY
jgi:hypothetical protein